MSSISVLNEMKIGARYRIVAEIKFARHDENMTARSRRRDGRNIPGMREASMQPRPQRTSNHKGAPRRALASLCRSPGEPGPA
jgi:hypothetical protein